MTEDEMRRSADGNFSSPIKEQLFDIYKESLYDDQDGHARVAKTIAKACALMARLSADQEKTAKKLVHLTWGLIVLTVGLLIYTVMLHQDSRELVEREKLTQNHEAKQP